MRRSILLWDHLGVFCRAKKKGRKGLRLCVQSVLKQELYSVCFVTSLNIQHSFYFKKKRRAVVECKHVGALGNTEVMGLKALSIVYI